MKPSSAWPLLLLPLIPLAPVGALPAPPPPPVNLDQLGFNIPSVRESAVLARRITHLTGIGTLSTVFPHHAKPAPARYGSDRSDGDGDDLPATPPPPSSSLSSDDLSGLPIGLPDYLADCEPDGLGNPTLLAMPIATSFRNARAGSNISLALRWTPPQVRLPQSAASMPRLALIGYLEPIAGDGAAELARCFVAAHPDAKPWLPGNPIHRSEWARLVVTHLYWVGGFGDRAYIGWIPAEVYAAVTRDEWEAARLPGEAADKEAGAGPAAAAVSDL